MLETERGFSLREVINKFSEYMMILRNKYNMIPVVIQQQSYETANLDAFKQGKIRASAVGLADSKAPSKDCSVMLGITNPYIHDLPSYLGYDVSVLRNNFRVLEIVLNREGQSNEMIGLYFNGAVNYFCELPNPTDPDIEKWYSWIKSRKEKKHTHNFFTYFKKLLNKQ